MTYKLRRPFITEDPNDLRRSAFVTRLATPKVDVLHFQGKAMGSKGRPSTWRVTEWDFANMLYALTVGYRGMLHLPGRRDIWTELLEKIEKDGRREPR